METAVQHPHSAHATDNATPTPKPRRYRVSRDYVRTPAEIRLDDDLQHAFASLRFSTKPEHRFTVYVLRRIPDAHTLPWRLTARLLRRVATVAVGSRDEVRALVRAIVARIGQCGDEMVDEAFRTPRPRFV